MNSTGYEILLKKELTPDTKLYEISAPLIAKKAKAGQFIILRLSETGERIPLTIADFDANKGTVTIVVQEVGKTTRELGSMDAGEHILNFIGPLGKPSEIEEYGTVVCIGGGVGIALIYPVICALKEKGNEVISIIGARNEELLIFEKEIGDKSDNLFITTDDGTKGHHGFVSDILKRLIDEGKKIDLVMAAGPIIMMKVVADVTRPYGMKTVVSLNPIMVDGTGMCGSCRVMVGEETKFACVDGPEFDGHLVDFDLLMARNARYLGEEAFALKDYEKCRCE